MLHLTNKMLVHSFIRPTRSLVRDQGWRYTNKLLFSAPASGAPAAHPLPPLIETVFQTIRDPKITEEITLKQDDNSVKIIAEHLQSYFIKGERLPSALITQILQQSTSYNQNLPNILTLSRSLLLNNSEKRNNINICGDTHGQFHDFCTIFDDKISGGYPSSLNTFIFNGDIADRGDKALEIFLFLLIIKLILPNSIHILRGNHETISMTNSFGFKKEIQRKYHTNASSLLQVFYEFFHSLPMAAVVENSIFVTHGGLGPDAHKMTIEEINSLNRFQETPHTGPLSELLWSGKRAFHHSFISHL